MGGRGLDGGAPAAAPGLPAALQALTEAVRRVSRQPAWVLSDEQLRAAVLGVQEQLAALEAARLALLRELDGRPGAVAGARADRVAATFLVHAARVAPGQAARDAAAAHALDPATGTLPGLGAALAAGQVSRAHLDVAGRAVSRIPAHLLAGSGAEQVDGFLTEQARRFSPPATDKLARHLLATLDPDGSDRFDPNAFTRRGLSCTVDGTGMLVGSFQLDPAGGAVVKAALDAYARPHPATPAPGQDVLLTDQRTRAQRNADALVTLARRALHDPDHTRDSGELPAEATRVLVLATAEQVAAASADRGGDGLAAADAGPSDGGPADAGPGDGGPFGGTAAGPADGGPANGGPANRRAFARIAAGPAAGAGWAGADGTVGAGAVECVQTGPMDPGTFRRLTCDALLQRVLIAPDGAVLNLGRTVRTVSPAQRRALIARDRGCTIPGCDAPLSACEAHHLRPWRAGGNTDLGNLALVCFRHHSGVHSGIWTIQSHPDGTITVIPPPWLDPHRRPLPAGTYHTAADQGRQLGRQLRLNLGKAEPD